MTLQAISVTEAAAIHGVTRQAIHIAIKNNKLKATQHKKNWHIKLDDLREYFSNRYNRAKSTCDGELIYDPNRGFYSIRQISQMLNVPYQKIYYAVRTGFLKSFRKNTCWVINIEDVESYMEQHLSKRGFGF